MTDKANMLYLGLCIIGAVVPWLFLLGFFTTPSPSVTSFITYTFVNPVSSAVAADLLISALVFLCYVLIEGKRLELPRLWVYFPATLLVGLSFSLPLFLYFRERQLAKYQP